MTVTMTADNIQKMGMQVMVVLCVAAWWTVTGILGASVEENEVNSEPQHVHLSFGEAPDQVCVVWATRSPCYTTKVKYGTSPWKLEFTVTGTSDNFTGPHNVFGLHNLHRATLTGLSESTTYYYRPVCNRIASGPFYFQSHSAGTEWSPQVLVMGELGADQQLLTLLSQRALSGQYSSALQLGGLSSYFSDDNGTAGDQLMQGLEQVAAFMPYMTAPGDYERAEADHQYFSYRHRFSMPGSVWPIPTHSLWYSFDLGPIHFVSVCTALYLHGDRDLQRLQQAWLVKDLSAANRVRNRRPWIVVFGRHPLYCSSYLNDSDCARNDSLVRAGLEETLYNQGVDLILQSHSQGYQRLHPVFKGVVLASNYTNPPAPIHITVGTSTTFTTSTATSQSTAATPTIVAAPSPLPSGSNGTRVSASSSSNSSNDSGSSVSGGGSISGGATEATVNMTAFQVVNGTEPTYGRLRVINATHAHWELLSGNTGREGEMVDTVVDSFMLVQERHGPFHLADLPKEQKDKIKPHLGTDGSSKPGILNANDTPRPHRHPLSDIIAAVDNHRQLVIGLSVGAAALLMVLLVVGCRLRHRRRRGRRGMVARRWDSMDYKYGKTKLTNDDDDDYDDDFKDANDGAENVGPDERLQTKRLITTH